MTVGSRLCDRCSTPSFLLVGYINSGYRVNYTYSECLQSIFSRHNETSNIWTSLLLFFFLLVWYPYVIFYELIHPTTSFMDYFVFSIYFIYLFFTALSSVAFHCFRCHSETANFKSMQFDFIGIMLTGFACAIPGLYYGFWRFPFWQNFYIILSLIGSFISPSMILGLPVLVRRQMLRVLFFIIASQYAAVWTTHLGFLAGFYDEEYTLMFYQPVIDFFSSCFVAIIFYLTHVPESIWPTKFDCIFTSHSFWHLGTSWAILNMGAAWVRYYHYYHALLPSL